MTDKVMDDQLVFYLKHKKAIREWARLEERERDAADSFFLSLQDDFAALAERLGVELWSNDPEHSSPAYRFYRQNWAKAREKPLVCVAFEYYRPKAAFDSPWTGIWFFEDWEKRDPVWQDELERIKTVLADTSTRLGIELPKRGRWRWWAVTHHTTPPAGYWKEEGMPKLRQHLLAEMRGTWEKYADLIDSVMGSS